MFILDASSERHLLLSLMDIHHDGRRHATACQRIIMDGQCQLPTV